MLQTIFNFDTTDYSTVELASAAKLTRYSLREKESHFSDSTSRAYPQRVQIIAVLSSGRAVISDTLPKSNTPLREFSETTLPEITTFTSGVKN